MLSVIPVMTDPRSVEHLFLTLEIHVIKNAYRNKTKFLPEGFPFNSEHNVVLFQYLDGYFEMYNTSEWKHHPHLEKKLRVSWIIDPG